MYCLVGEFSVGAAEGGARWFLAMSVFDPTPLAMLTASRDLRRALSRPGRLFFESSSRSIFLFEHDLFGKPVSTFPDHAVGGVDTYRIHNMMAARATTPG